MHKVSLFLIALAALLLVSCEKNSLSSETTVNRIIDVENVAMKGLGEFVMEEVDSRISVTLNGLQYEGVVYERRCDLPNFQASAVFNDRMDAAGSVFVESFPLEKIEEGGKFRYLLDASFLPPDFDPNEIARRGEIEISFESEMPETYGSFTETFTFPKPLCLEVSFTGTEEHSKSEDVTFTWEPDDRCKSVYAAFCAPGVPCIFKQFDDAAGSGTIEASEIADFPVGKEAWLLVGRGMGGVVEHSSGQKTGVLRYLYVIDIATILP